MSSEPSLEVRQMRLDEVDLRINYFHDASDEHLLTLGVDRALLPSRDAWRAFYVEDYARPLSSRENYTIVWTRNGDAVGFSSTDRIRFGRDAFMHLHIVEPTLRKSGLGTRFVRMSVVHYFNVLELELLYCEPNALNVAPNRTLQDAGFRYLFTHEAQPSSINFLQLTTRWVIDRS